jgi:hypothetical protein
MCSVINLNFRNGSTLIKWTGGFQDLIVRAWEAPEVLQIRGVGQTRPEVEEISRFSELIYFSEQISRRFVCFFYSKKSFFCSFFCSSRF